MAAGFTTSAWVEAQAILKKQMQDPEFRHEPYYLIKLMLERAKGMFTKDKLDNLMKSDSQTVNTYVLAKRAADPVTARSHDHSRAAFGDSQEVTLSFSIKGFEYGTSLKLSDNNIFNAATLLSNDLLSQSIANANVIEALIATYIATYPTYTNDASGSYSKFGNWNDTDKVWEIPADEKDYMFQYIQEIMSINNYNGSLDFICDPVAYALSKQIREQGSGNKTNLGWQVDNLNLVKSARVVDSDYTATVYVIPTETVGMVQRIPSLNRAGKSTKDYEYDSMMDILNTGLEYATHYREVGADTSSTGGATQDVILEFENTDDLAFVKAPLSSSSNDSTIFKFGLKE